MVVPGCITADATYGVCINPDDAGADQVPLAHA